MSNIYLMFVDLNPHAVDWITYCRAHMLNEALPNCAGIYRLSQAPSQLRDAAEGWNLYILCHGDAATIGGLSGAELADALHPVIPVDKLGLIHLQSCKTGQRAAGDFAERLGQLGHHAIIKAPGANATFTEEVGFRVLDVGRFTPDLNRQYQSLLRAHENAGKRAVAGGGGGNLQGFCRTVFQATKPFWDGFSKLFKQCALPMGSGWRAYETIPGSGCKEIS